MAFALGHEHHHHQGHSHSNKHDHSKVSIIESVNASITDLFTR